MKKAIFTISIMYLIIISMHLKSQTNELGYRAAEISSAKQLMPKSFMDNSSAVMLNEKGSFIYSSFNKVASNGSFVNYADNESYTKTISAQGANDKVNLRFYYFSTEANTDVLYIYDGPDANGHLLAVLSGSLANNTTYKSSGNSITLKFISNAVNTDRGFKLYAYPEGSFTNNQLAQKNVLACNSTPASNECVQAPLICDFNTYCGTTSSAYTAGNTTGLGNFCGSIENNSWLSFIASAANVSFVVTSANCLDNSAGIQTVIYDTPDCLSFTEVSICESQTNGVGTFTISNNVPLQIGHTYYMMLDGFAGNVCSYSVTAGPGMIGSVSINTPYPEICAGITTTLTSSIASSNYSWTDNFGNTYANQQSITVSPTVTTTYSLVVDPNSCGIAEAVRTVSVNAILSAPSIGSPATICSGTTVTLTTNAAGYNYVWTGPNGFTSSVQNPVIPNFTSSNSGTYSLNVNINASCAANEAVKIITVSVSPTVGLIAATTSLCNFNGSSSITFTASGVAVGNNYMWNWNPLQANAVTQNCVVIPFTGVNCTNSPINMPGLNAGSILTLTPNMPTTICVVGTATNGCVSTSTCINITEASTAITQLTGSTAICRGDSSLITVTGTAPFAWTFPVNSGTLTLSSDGDSLWVKPTNPVTYMLKAVDAASCTANRTISMLVDTLCVWPGDTDRDGIVTQNDLLPLGIYYGESGTSRPYTSLNWEGQYCAAWAQTQAGGLNAKHVDTNGDGVINASDTLAVYQNITLTHALRPATINSINPEVSITFHKPMYNANDTVIAYVHFGADTAQLTNFYGAAFKLTFDDAMIQPNTERFNFINSWVGTPLNNVLTFNYLHTSSRQFLEGFVRNTHGNATGYGKVAEAKFLLKTALTSTVFSVSFTDGIKTSNDHNIKPLTSVTATVPVNVNVVTGLSDIDQSLLYIHPNPTNGSLTINSKYNLQKVEVSSITGQILLTELCADKTHQLQLPNFANGIYFVKVMYTNGTTVTKKIIRN